MLPENPASDQPPTPDPSPESSATLYQELDADGRPLRTTLTLPATDPDAPRVTVYGPMPFNEGLAWVLLRFPGLTPPQRNLIFRSLQQVEALSRRRPPRRPRLEEQPDFQTAEPELVARLQRGESDTTIAAGLGIPLRQARRWINRVREMGLVG